MDKNAPTMHGSGDLWSSFDQNQKYSSSLSRVPYGARIVVLCYQKFGLSTLKGVEEEEECVPLGLRPYPCRTLPRKRAVCPRGEPTIVSSPPAKQRQVKSGDMASKLGGFLTFDIPPIIDILISPVCFCAIC